MWGAPGSGKTTFLAALHTALMREDTGFRLGGADDASTHALADLTISLTSRGEFPRPTAGIERFHWTLIGQRLQRGRRSWWPSDRRSVEWPVRITLDLADSPGEAATARMGSAMHLELVESLAHSTGIIICFDPIREFEVGDTFDHVAGLLTNLSYALRDAPGARLPQHVAVCVTKFDDLRLLRTAQALRVIDYDPAAPEFPRVPEEDAREFLLRLCRLSASGTAELVPKLIEQTFYPEHVRYFVTSAIGFYVDPWLGVYDPDDQQNVVPGSKTSEPPRIRGSIHPINVVEPVVWLASQMPDEPPR
jgi:hypothetical protein